jgi:hypothetical protein
MAPQAIEKARFGLGNGAAVTDRVTALSERGYK